MASFLEMRKVLDEEKPDVVLTHWPIDTTRDHSVCSLLVFDAWLRLGRKSALYYYEVQAGEQTPSPHFRPTHYVDITAVEGRKREANFAHASQDVASYYPLHEALHRFRGIEYRVKYAEGFARHVQSRDETLP